MIPKEIWKDINIKGIKNRYQISSLGLVKSITLSRSGNTLEKILTQNTSVKGICSVTLNFKVADLMEIFYYYETIR